MSDDVQRRRDDDQKGFAEVLRAFRTFSSPQNRVAEHLLYLDLNETYRFAHCNPEALRQVAP